MMTRIHIAVPMLATARDDADVPRHTDSYAHLDHQMPEATAEASASLLTHVVPVIYGALFGSLVGYPLLGLSLGVVAVVAMDVRLNEKSLIRPRVHDLMCRYCPYIARETKRFARRHARWALRYVESACVPPCAHSRRQGHA